MPHGVENGKKSRGFKRKEDFGGREKEVGVACKLLNRKFIGIELEEKYFKIAKERISQN